MRFRHFALAAGWLAGLLVAACGHGDEVETASTRGNSPGPEAAGQAGTGGAGGQAGQAGAGGMVVQTNIVRALSTGYAHTCVLLESKAIKCWGANYDGELGLGDTEVRGDDAGEMGVKLPFVDLGKDPNATRIAAGFGHSCAMLDTGKPKCWGDNNAGQLGLGNKKERGQTPGNMGDKLPVIDLGTHPPIQSFSIGSGFNCVLFEGGKIKCWGYNYYGQLGQGNQQNLGDEPGEMGDNLPFVDLGTGAKVTSLFTGENSACAILEGGKVKCWGNNTFGQLGLGDTEHRGDNPGEMGDNLPFVDLGTGARAIAVSGWSLMTCALLDSGQVKCWGTNQSGQLGLGDEKDRGVKPGEMGDNLPFVDLGTGAKVTSLTTSQNHSCALLDSGQVKCWGSNGYGQLGLGEDSGRGKSPGEMGDNLPPVDLGAGLQVVSLAAGGDHTCALFSNQRLKCWGDNNYGELGQGDRQSRGNTPGSMGDHLPFVVFGKATSP